MNLSSSRNSRKLPDLQYLPALCTSSLTSVQTLECLVRFVDNGNSCHGSGGRGFPYDVELDCCIIIYLTDKGAAEGV